MKSTTPGIISDEPITLKLEKIGDLFYPWTAESEGEPVEFKLHRSSARKIAAQIHGSLTSPEKNEAARKNGKLGGRPRSEFTKSIAEIKAEKAARREEKALARERRAAVKNPKTALPLFPADGLPSTPPAHPSHSATPKKGGLGGKRARPKLNPADGFSSTP